MNGLSSVASPTATPVANQPSAQEAGGSEFDQIFERGLVSTSAVLFQFIGADIIELVMKDETAVD